MRIGHFRFMLCTALRRDLSCQQSKPEVGISFQFGHVFHQFLIYFAIIAVKVYKTYLFVLLSLYYPKDLGKFNVLSKI